MIDWKRLAPKPPTIARWREDITGLRFYSVPDGNGGTIGVPGCTSVLSWTAPQSDQDRLERWRARELAAGRDPNAAADRGTACHSVMERMLRGFPPEYDNSEIEEYCQGMFEPVRRFESVDWSEKPIRDDWQFAWNTTDLEDKNRMARVWSTSLGVAGTPDLVGRIDGKYALLDFKTAKSGMHRPEPGERVPFDQKFPYMKFCKARKQLALYGLMLKETFGITIDQYELSIGLPGDQPAQHIVCSRGEIERELNAIINAAKDFWLKYEWALEDSKRDQAQPELAAA